MYSALIFNKAYCIVNKSPKSSVISSMRLWISVSFIIKTTSGSCPCSFCDFLCKLSISIWFSSYINSAPLQNKRKGLNLKNFVINIVNYLFAVDFILTDFGHWRLVLVQEKRRICSKLVCVQQGPLPSLLRLIYVEGHRCKSKTKWMNEWIFNYKSKHELIECYNVQYNCAGRVI